MRVVLGGEKAAIAMQDIRKTRIFIVITPLLFFEVTVTTMFVRGEQIEQGMAGMSKIAKGRVNVSNNYCVLVRVRVRKIKKVDKRPGGNTIQPLLPAMLILVALDSNGTPEDGGSSE